METQVDSYIETYTGKKFYFLSPTLDMIDIEDIAHSLSMQVRYTGHAKKFYSIAEHSLLVESLCKPENKLWGLLHDASEAYLTDVASPIKPFLKNYKMLEQSIMDMICLKYGLEPSMPEDVKNADLEALRHEAFQLMKSKGKTWAVNQDREDIVEPIELSCMSPQEVKKRFIERFKQLTHQGS